MRWTEYAIILSKKFQTGILSIVSLATPLAFWETLHQVYDFIGSDGSHWKLPGWHYSFHPSLMGFI